MLDIKLVSNGSDWEGVYLNGELLLEHSSISAHALINALADAGVISGKYAECNSEWLDEECYFPANFDDVVF